jgi:hypothetical protein
LLRDIYVDNLITGVPDPDNALALYKKTVNLFLQCSMNLQAWATNDVDVRNSLLEFHREKSAAISVLGIIWNQYNDTFTIKKIKREGSVTLRTITSTAATFYDPAGWFSTISVRSKLLLRDIRTDIEKCGWDDHLPDHYVSQWNLIQDDLDTACSSPIKRFQSDIEVENASYQLHTFVDASARALACVSYLRVQSHVDGLVQTFFLFAKTKLARPNTTIPKLELFAAILGTRAVEYIRAQLPLTFAQEIIWSDSKCVLHWIQSNKILPTFTQRCVDQIRNVPDITFCYVPSGHNPADLPTKGIEFSQLEISNWWTAPIWLQTEQWPAPHVASDTGLTEIANEPILQIIHTTVLHVNTTIQSPFGIQEENFSSLGKLLRITAKCMSFVSRFEVAKRRNLFQNHDQNTKRGALLLWIQHEQAKHFSSELDALCNKQKSPLIKELNIHIIDGLLRTVNRMQYQPVDQDEKRLILLPKKSCFTKLLIMFFHRRNFHAGTAHTLAAIRRQYWILQG